MAIENPDVVDAVGLEKESGAVVLTIADAWDWQDERGHLTALQAKLNSYLNYIESGQIWESFPDAAQRQVVIEVVGRFPLPHSGSNLLKHASVVAAGLRVEIRHRHYAGAQNQEKS